MKILLSISLTLAALALSTAWPLTRKICFPGGGVVSVKLKHIHVHAETLCNQTGTSLVRKTAHAGPLMEVHHLVIHQINASIIIIPFRKSLSHFMGLTPIWLSARFIITSLQ
jgi:hypothetical protein